MENLKGKVHFDEFSDCLFKDLLEDFEINSDDGLVWIEYLKDYKVRSILSVALMNYKRIGLGTCQRNCLQLKEVFSEKLINDTGVNSYDDLCRIMLLSAIASLQLYVVDNFVCFINSSEGFNSFEDCLQFVDDLFEMEPEASGTLEYIDYTLDVDGEKVHSVARNSVLLKLARFIITSLMASSTLDAEHDQLRLFHLLVWSLRCAVVHQISLKTITSSLHQEVMSYTDQIVAFLKDDSKNNLELNPQFKLNILNEIVSSSLIFGEVEHSKRYFKMAQELSGLKFDLTGCLGTRTLYQSKPVPQLMVDVQTQDDREEIREEGFKVSLPRNEKLEDDTLLQDVKFVGTNQSDESLTLTENEQCFLLAAIKYTKRFGPSNDNLLREELLAYIYFLLEKTNVWPVAFSLLELRSIFERNNRRRVERSMKQLETLSYTVRSEHENRFLFSEALGRTRYFFSSLPSPFWIVEKHLADLLVSLGVLKSALEVYLRLELWTQVIDCYRQLGRPDKAEEIVRKKLEQDGDNQPDLHCLLGEITGNIENYHHSWKISGERYAPAPKMLGLHYFGLKDFDRALDYFQQSVSVNSMQLDVWYRIGFIGLTQEKWEMAANAYRRVLQFYEDAFEAWNNLSKAYIKLGDKTRAMRTLQEAIKCNFDEWKLWDNYIAVAADVGAFNEVIQAWNRLIELKGSYIDDTIGDILVSAFVRNLKDSDGDPVMRYLAKALKLYGRIEATSDGSANIWRQYATLLMLNRDSETSKITRCLQRCHRKVLATSGWDKDADKLLMVVKHSIWLANEYLAVAEVDQRNQATILNPCRLALNSILVQANRAKDDLANVKVNKDKIPDMNLYLSHLEEKFEFIRQILSQIE